MTPNIWHQHKTWPYGMWVKYTNSGNFKLENAYHSEYLKTWLQEMLLEPYIPEDYTLRSDDCQYVWLKKDFGAVDIEWTVCGIFKKEPPKVHRFVKVFLNLKTNEWSIT